MQRLLFSFLFLCILLPTLSFAADDKADCSLFVKDLIVNTSYENIFPQKNVIIAINNLKNYCCQKKLMIDMSMCKNIPDTDGANSNILYDHLIDVGFRSLDGEKNLYYNKPTVQVGHTIGEEWKKKITDYATNPLGAIPIKVRNDFGRYRGFTMQGGVKVSLDEYKDCRENNVQYENYNNNRDKNPINESEALSSLGLAEKYFVLCHIAQCLQPNKRMQNYYQACRNIALQRIYDEMNYVQIVAINQGLAGLVNNFNAYAQGYFVQGQLSQLLEKITEMDAGLTHINSKVSEMTKTCSS